MSSGPRGGISTAARGVSPFAAPTSAFSMQSPKAYQVPHATVSMCANPINPVDMLMFGSMMDALATPKVGSGIASSEPKEKALGRKYSLVGNWDNWGSFTSFDHKEDSKADGAAFVAEVPVSASKDIEFQILGDGDWKQRLYPAGDVVMGPTPDGHGANWHHDKPAKDGKLQVKFYPS